MAEPLNEKELNDARTLLDNEAFWDMVAERWRGPAKEAGSRLFITSARLQEQVEEAVQVMNRALSSPGEHVHEWIDARNEVVKSGEMCRCGALRSRNKGHE